VDDAWTTPALAAAKTDERASDQHEREEPTRITIPAGAADSFWLWSMQVGLKAPTTASRRSRRTDLTEDLKRINVPTLIIHGDDDQIVPIDASARRSVELVPDATLKVYPAAPTAWPRSPHKDQFNADLLAFLGA
jgi:non-heme chloroperoxidase